MLRSLTIENVDFELLGIYISLVFSTNKVSLMLGSDLREYIIFKWQENHIIPINEMLALASRCLGVLTALEYLKLIDNDVYNLNVNHYCHYCGRLGSWRLQGSAYHKKLDNYACYCNSCQEDADLYWEQQWDEYYAGRGL